MSGNDAVTPASDFAALSDSEIRETMEGQAETTIATCIRVRDYLRDNHLSMKGFARECGIPHGTLSGFFNGTYNGNYEKTADRLEQYFAALEKKRIFGGCTDFVNTHTSRALCKVYEKTRYNRRIQFIQSAEQCGKTKTAEYYTRANNSGRTVLVTLEPGGTSNPFGVFMRLFAEAMGISTDHQKIMEVRMNIRAKLKRCDLVIIDEGHMVNKWGPQAQVDFWNYLRIAIHSNGERGIVIQWTNSDAMHDLNVFRVATRYNLGQLLGRTVNEPIEIHGNDIPVDDVALMVERYFKPKAATLRKLHDLATRPMIGHFGLLNDILTRAWSESQVEKKPMNDELILEIANDTLANLEKHKDLYKEL